MKTFCRKNPNYENPARKVASYQAQSRRLWSCTRRQQRSCPALSWCCRNVAMRGLPSRWSWSEALPLITDIIVPTAAVAERVLRRQLMLADRWLAVHFRRRDIAAAGGRRVRRLRRRWWWWWTTMTTYVASQRRSRRVTAAGRTRRKDDDSGVLVQTTAARLL